MKRKIILCVLGIILIFSTSALAENNIPNDISGHWAEDSINILTSAGLISGYPDGSFKPDAAITRAEFITIVNRLFGFNTMSEVGIYNDIKASDWYYKEIQYAKTQGYVSGYPGNYFKPNELITREQAAVMLTKALNESGNNASQNNFSDSQAISSWAAQSINVMSEKKLISGYPDGEFKPLKSMTRAEAVSVLKAVIEYRAQSLVISENNSIEITDNQSKPSDTDGKTATLSELKGTALIMPQPVGPGSDLTIIISDLSSITDRYAITTNDLINETVKLVFTVEGNSYNFYWDEENSVLYAEFSSPNKWTDAEAAKINLHLVK